MAILLLPDVGSGSLQIVYVLVRIKSMKFGAGHFLVFLLLWGLVAAGQQPAREESGLERAMQLASSGELDRAVEILAALEKSNPADAEVQYRFGLVLLKQGRLAEARRRLESAVKLAPQSPLPWLGVAQARLRGADAPGAVKASERARAAAPRDPTVLRALAIFEAEAIEYYIRTGQAGPAVDLARKAIDGAGSNAAFHNLLGRAFELKKNSAAAVEELQQAIRLDPARASYYFDLAQLFLDHNTPEPAEMILQNAVRTFPKHAEVLRLLGLASYAQGKTREALDAFLKAIDADPELESAYASLETLLPEAQDHLDEITLKLRRFSENRPSSPVGHYLLALVSPAGAEPLLRKAIQAAPDFWPAYYELHKLLKAQGKWQEATTAVQRAVELNPEYAPAHYALAEIYSRMGDRPRAAQERELHHKLLTQQQAAATRRREEAPRLTYKLE